MGILSKYHAVPVSVDGIRFASKAEAARYAELRMLERAGKIKDLELQPAYVLIPPFVDAAGKKHRGIVYRADFRYLRLDTWQNVTEDVKSVATAQNRVYKLKKEMLYWRYPSIVFEEYMA